MSTFANANTKATHIFSAQILAYMPYLMIKVFHNKLTNDIVSFEQPGPEVFPLPWNAWMILTSFKGTQYTCKILFHCWETRLWLPFCFLHSKKWGNSRLFFRREEEIVYELPPLIVYQYCCYSTRDIHQNGPDSTVTLIIMTATSWHTCTNSLQKHTYSNILNILPPENENFQIKILIFFILLHKT